MNPAFNLLTKPKTKVMNGNSRIHKFFELQCASIGSDLGSLYWFSVMTGDFVVHWCEVVGAIRSESTESMALVEN